MTAMRDEPALGQNNSIDISGPFLAFKDADSAVPQLSKIIKVLRRPTEPAGAKRTFNILALTARYRPS